MDCNILHFALLNIRSLNNKAIYLKDWVVEHNIDLLAITEYWLNLDCRAENTINELCPKGCAMMHVPRNGFQGGGVGLLYNKFYKMELPSVANYSSFEYIQILFRLPATALKVAIWQKWA